MLELLTGAGLATASGLNAALPLLILGALDRWTPLVELPESWQWVSNGWVLVVLGGLLLLEVVADKVPGVDSVNDVVQTVVRPTAGGLAFGAGSGSQTVAVTDPAAFFTSGSWVPVAIGVLLALTVHTGKALGRPVVNAATAGVGAPLASTLEDLTSLGLTIAALLVPVLVVVGLGLLAWAGVRTIRRRRRRRALRPAGGL
ncbi:DUF4126 domain-containing protein [Actinotalea ferrariae]|uniref:DUF4126 domain-containing protein n=1 Tax=Actinotalea ferrariae TaxID=1386098 RepID=UPI001C8B2F28|nr:DUF4126 domain-containing protein [Actinotalea ferrariae]MBX9245097.1 DUF4126 domain-containing protein [Actinotalea ferrariae]